MKRPISFKGADNLYVVAEHAEYKLHTISNPEFQVFFYLLAEMRRAVHLSELDDTFAWYTQPLTRFAYSALCSCLPYESLALNVPQIIREKATAINSHYGDLRSKSLKVLDAYDAMLLTQNPLLASIVAEVNYEPAALVAVRGSRSLLLQYTRNLQQLKKMEVVSPFSLRAGRLFNKLLITEPSPYFEKAEFVHAAPRSSQIHFFQYQWYNYGPYQSLIEALGVPFYGEELFKLPMPKLQRVTIALNGGEAADIQKSVERMIHGEDSQSKRLVKARALKLEGAGLYLLEADKKTRVLVLDFSRDAKCLQELTDDLELGSFIIIRTEGGGDLIPLYADKLLGNQAQEARACQDNWKSRLRFYVSEKGENATIKALGQKVSLAQIRYWVGNTAIHPERLETFCVVMNLIGLAGQTEHYWSMLSLIERKHAEAGRLIREELLRQVRDMDEQELDKLETEGKYDFTLHGAGKLTAYRLCAISSDIDNVPQTLLHKIITDHELWLE